MKIVTKTALLAVSVLLSAGLGFAADIKGATKTAGDAVKSDSKASVPAAKENVKGKAADTKAAAKAKVIDINSATDAELKAVPGIGAAYAAKIIAGRPYANKTQLRSRKIMPPVLYEQVKDRVTATQPKK